MALRLSGRVVLRVFAMIGLITVLTISTPLVSWWARAYAGPIDRPHGDVLILLSAAADDKGGVSYSSYWRARYAVLAWQSGNFKKILVSGGGGPGIENFLAASGVPRGAIISEWHSTSTRENAIEAGRLLQGIPGKKVLLTSDFHMYRALRVFRKMGLDVSPMPAPDALHAAQNWYGRFGVLENLLVESAKIIDYRVHGWI